MSVPALRVEEPTFREGIEHYVTTKCRLLHVPSFDAEDLAQEAMTNIVAKVSSFEPEKSDFEQWARGIAWNVIREYVRRAKLYFALFTEYHANVYNVASSEPSPERCARRNQARCAIENASQGISSRQAQVLVLHAVHDMSHEEIGGELCISNAMSQKDYQRALDHLALCLAGKAFAVMPPSLTGCDEPNSFNANHSRWAERSHYAAHIIASIVVLLMFVPSCLEPKKLEMLESKSYDARVLDATQNAVMYSSDELSKVQDEPSVFQDAPTVKPEPASLTSVQVVPTPTRHGDKQTYVEDLAPIPPFKPTESTTAHLPPGRLNAAF